MIPHSHQAVFCMYKSKNYKVNVTKLVKNVFGSKSKGKIRNYVLLKEK